MSERKARMSELADAIVALTGPSAERVNAAIRLLEQGKGERVLISGVNREVRRRELRELVPGSSRLFNCCVDLGFEAEDTVGNAQEIAAWARAKGYDHLIVVTSDYHMPRSLVEIRGQLPGVKLIPYAVSTPSLDNARWWRAAVTARRSARSGTKVSRSSTSSSPAGISQSRWRIGCRYCWIRSTRPSSSIATIARASRTMGFSSLGTEPWPARPVARRRPQPRPLSAVCNR